MSYQYECEGFLFIFNDDGLWLNSSVLELHSEQDSKLLGAIGYLQAHFKPLLAWGHLGKLAKKLNEYIVAFNTAKFIPPWDRNLIRGYKSDEQQAQIELWYSYLIEYPPHPITSNSDIWRIWELIDEVTNLLDQLVEYERFRDLAPRFPNAHPGYVYLFQLSTGHYKIGFSNNPQRRGREITSGLPFSIELLHQIQSNQIACLEHELHVRYADKRHGDTEWFSLTDEEVLQIKAIPDCTYPWVGNSDWDIEFRREGPKPTLPPRN